VLHGDDVLKGEAAVTVVFGGARGKVRRMLFGQRGKALAWWR
jgi:hypothetical protein